MVVGDGLGLKSVNDGVFFYDFPLIFKVFINIHEYANFLICKLGNLHLRSCDERLMSNFSL